MSGDLVLVEKHNRVGRLRLNAPPLNALSQAMIAAMNAALATLEADSEVRCIVVTGNEKIFCAGGDAREVGDTSFAQVYNSNFITGTWGHLALWRKPTIAAVSGLALAGGCELAMMADILVAGESAKFGQPEICIATLPGSGGTQRLTRALGKAKAMKMVLTGWTMGAAEAERAGLVSDVVPDAELMTATMKIAERIATMSLPALMLAKEAVNSSFETMLREGIRGEQRLFHASFALEDRQEGMRAFKEKRPPVFKDR